MKLKLYEVQATEYNGEQEYSQSKLLVAKNIKHARQITSDSGMTMVMNHRNIILIILTSLNLSVAVSD